MLVLNWRKLPVGVPKRNQGVPCESHVEKGAPHIKCDHAALVNKESVLLLVSLAADKAVEQMQNSVCGIFYRVDIGHATCVKAMHLTL